MFSRSVSDIVEARRSNHHDQKLPFVSSDCECGHRHARTLKIQFAVVDIAFAGARIAKGVISAGYNQVIPSHPTAKKELKTNKKTAATMPRVFVCTDVVPARMAMEADWPIAPNTINLRLPKRSIVNMAIKEAKKYSVPFKAASSRLVKPLKPILSWKIVAA